MVLRLRHLFHSQHKATPCLRSWRTVSQLLTGTPRESHACSLLCPHSCGLVATGCRPEIHTGQRTETLSQETKSILLLVPIRAGISDLGHHLPRPAALPPQVSVACVEVRHRQSRQTWVPWSRGRLKQQPCPFTGSPYPHSIRYDVMAVISGSSFISWINTETMLSFSEWKWKYRWCYMYQLRSTFLVSVHFFHWNTDIIHTSAHRKKEHTSRTPNQPHFYSSPNKRRKNSLNRFGPPTYSLMQDFLGH